MSELQDRQITLGGQTYTVRFSIRAMLALKQRWGLEKESDVERRMKAAGMEDFIVILWAGLQTHHPELTEAQVLGWMDDGGLDGIVAIQEAVEAAAPPERPKRGQQRNRGSR